ncbi:hypothetical protein [Nonomuraea sp. NPDC049309]|uniref:hypothetical protein n=1 Tax=Nonomuraea sp. NPDC049309 TaxID=3364350 RepID=UPI0037229F9A
MPSSWPEPPRRETPPAPAWPEPPAAEAPTSWPEPPRRTPEPSWPEPPRKDPSWPEPPAAPRPRGARRDAGGYEPASTSPDNTRPDLIEPVRPESARPQPGRHDGGLIERRFEDGRPSSGRYESGRHDSGPHNSGPHSSGPQSSGPHSGGPQSSGPHSGGPRDGGPEPSWPEQPRGGGWPESSPQSGPITSWPEANPHDTQTSWPEPVPPPQSPGGPGGWPEVSPKGAPPPGQPADPVPAWAQPPAPSNDAWSNLSGSNLSGPATWPPADAPADPPPAERTVMYDKSGTPRHDLPPPETQDQPPRHSSHPADERTVTYAQHTENLLNERAVPSTSMDSTHTGTPAAEDASARPGSNLSRDPSDPEHRFVTAGQISGSRTPPPERQQELWNTVFGDNYQAMGEQDELDEDSGKPVWIYALGGSAAVALVAALLWAFLWGPLASDDAASAGETAATATASQKPTATKTATSIGPLPKYPGKASPVTGRLAVASAGISVPRLGGEWQLDQRPAATINGTYNFTHRQYVQVAPQRFAVIMAGPLQDRMASYYEEDNLEPVIKQVVLDARKRFFPTDNKVRKIAQQPIKVGDRTGRLIAYSLTSDTEKATIATIAVNTGAAKPAIVFMSIPADKKSLLPDIRTVMNQIRLTNAG